MAVQIPTRERRILMVKRGRPGHGCTCPTVDILKTISRASTGTVRMTIWVYWMRARWCHLANTIEPFVCGGDAALCQITFDRLSCLCCRCMIGRRASGADRAYGRSCSLTPRPVRDPISSHIICRSTTSAFRVSSN